MPSLIKVTPVIHKGRAILIVEFNFDKDAVKRFKALPGAKWSATLKAWYLPDTAEYRKRFQVPAKTPVGTNVLVQINEVNRPALAKLEELLVLKNYSLSTRKTYMVEFAQFLYVLGRHPVNDVDYDRLRKYLSWCLREKKISANQLHSRINAIKFYFEQVLGKEDFYYEIPRPKKPLLLPKVLAEESVLNLLNAATNKKHKLLLSLGYGMGLRVSEICILKINDIDSERMQVLIEAAKGKKDRYVNLPLSILAALREYYVEYRPKKFLFEGQFGGPYSIRSAQQVFKDCLHRAGINKNVGIHSLRHSFATHLLEAGTDISLIQKLLGHNDIKTTLIYTHVSIKTVANVESPLDKITRPASNKG